MNINLVETCGACPEAYDALLPDGNYLGHLRLRHGIFTVKDAKDEVLLVAYPEGDGIFEWEERDKYLNLAKKELTLAYFLSRSVK